MANSGVSNVTCAIFTRIPAELRAGDQVTCTFWKPLYLVKTINECSRSHQLAPYCWNKTESTWFVTTCGKFVHRRRSEGCCTWAGTLLGAAAFFEENERCEIVVQHNIDSTTYMNHSFVLFPPRHQFPSPHPNHQPFPVLNDDLNRPYPHLWVVCHFVSQDCLHWLTWGEQNWDLLFVE